MPEDYPAGGSPDIPISAGGKAAAMVRERVPWRAAGTGVVGVGTPIGAAALYPVLGWIVAFIELAATLTVLGTVLFGSEALSERASRLLRWIGNRAEPPAPPPGHLGGANQVFPPATPPPAPASAGDDVLILAASPVNPGQIALLKKAPQQKTRTMAIPE